MSRRRDGSRRMSNVMSRSRQPVKSARASGARGREVRVNAVLLQPEHWRPELEELLSRAREQGVRCDSGSAERLAIYCAELARWSARMNLVSRREISQLVSKHVAASMGVFLVEEPRADEQWLDVGTGGGLPGMVVKLCRLGQPIALLDSSRKKTVFLEEIRLRMELADLAVIWSRVEDCARAEDPVADVARASLGSVAVMLMRAVAPLSAAFPLIDRLASRGTRLLTYKGPNWERELAVAKPEMERLRWDFVSMTPIPWAPARILRFDKS